MKILFIGDIVGRPGRRILSDQLRKFRESEQIDFCIANAENIANGSGVTGATLEKLFSYGADVATTGDHIYKNKEVMDVIEKESRLLRPLNYQEKALGRGYGVYEVTPKIRIGVVNLQGRIFMNPAECPFAAAEKAVGEISKQTSIIFVDIHAEATSEKVALGRYLDGRVSAVLGTHTHIQTADEAILPGGTAYLTDAGMTGPYDSIIGREVKPVLTKLTTGMPTRFNVAKHDVRICGAVVDVNENTGKANRIERVCLKDKEEGS